MMFYSESLLLSSPYLTHLMRITSKFDLDVIYHPHDTNFPQYVKSCCFHLSFSFSNYKMQAFRNSNHHIQLYSLHCTNVPSGCEGQGRGWLAPRNCRNIYVQTVISGDLKLSEAQSTSSESLLYSFLSKQMRCASNSED